MAYYGQTGTNPRWGRDNGAPPPPGGAYGVPPVYSAYPGTYYSTPYAIVPPPAYTAYAASHGTSSAPRPLIDPDLPAANMTNTTGGTGCEPGYNYFFAAENTKIHVLRCGATPPWQLPAGNACTLPYNAVHVPTRTTVGELLRGFGATNANPKKNQVWEVTQGTTGAWYSGLHFDASDEAAMAKQIREVGWDKSRGRDGKPPVWLYITKD